jgi:NAD-dependent deacetylase
MNRSLTKFQSLVILTGAGISAESGIRTFRDQNGLWEDHRIEDVASPEGYRRNPELVQNFYNLRRQQLQDPTVKPNPAHAALARLEQEWEGDFLLVTQNVDNLHVRAGSKRLLHMHGELNSAWCKKCDGRFSWQQDLSAQMSCPGCQAKGGLRPDIVWFGEIPYHMNPIADSLQKAEIFISIGTSGLVYPAAGFVREAWNAHRIEVNAAESGISDRFHEHRIGMAGTEVPKLVDELLG